MAVPDGTGRDGAGPPAEGGIMPPAPARATPTASETARRARPLASLAGTSSGPRSGPIATCTTEGRAPATRTWAGLKAAAHDKATDRKSVV